MNGSMFVQGVKGVKCGLSVWVGISVDWCVDLVEELLMNYILVLVMKLVKYLN